MTGPTGVDGSVVVHGDEGGITGATGVLLGGGMYSHDEAVAVVVSHGVDDGTTGLTGVEALVVVQGVLVELFAHREEKMGPTGQLEGGGGGGGDSADDETTGDGVSQLQSLDSASTRHGFVLLEMDHFGVAEQAASPAVGEVCEHVKPPSQGDTVPTPFVQLTISPDAGPTQNVPVERGHLIVLE
jgi:hypothetical protein